MVDVKVWRASDNNLHVILPPGRLLPDHVAMWFGVLSRLHSATAHGVVVHAQQLRSLDWNAASMLAGEQVPRVVRAMAFVTGASCDAAETLRLFTYFHKPRFDMRVFESRFLAIRWLASLNAEPVASPRLPEFVPVNEMIAARGQSRPPQDPAE